MKHIREVMLYFVMLVCGFAAAGMPMAKTPLGDLKFEVLRGGEGIGRHDISFSQTGDELHVRVAIDLEVTFAFLTLFSYTHRNHEIWKDGRLVAIETMTDDDGEEYWVRGKALDTVFAVEGSSGVFEAPIDIMPTSYWHPETPRQARMLDTQHGRIVNLSITPAGMDTEFPGARRYRVDGDLELDLWYGREDMLEKISFEARGATVEYRSRAE